MQLKVMTNMKEILTKLCPNKLIEKHRILINGWLFQLLEFLKTLRSKVYVHLSFNLYK